MTELGAPVAELKRAHDTQQQVVVEPRKLAGERFGRLGGVAATQIAGPEGGGHLLAAVVSLLCRCARAYCAALLVKVAEH